MKIAILLLTILTIGCGRPSKIVSLSTPETIDSCEYKINVIKQQHAELMQYHDSLLRSVNERDSLFHASFNPMQSQNDSLRSALKIQNFRINRIKYYVTICNKKPSQDKFLKGWVNRALR